MSLNFSFVVTLISSSRSRFDPKRRWQSHSATEMHLRLKKGKRKTKKITQRRYHVRSFRHRRVT